jgi:para-aminobenzoate synthetase component 1
MPQPSCSSFSASQAAGEWQSVDLEPDVLAIAASLQHLGGLVLLDSADLAPGARSFLTAAPTQMLHGHIQKDWPLITEALRSSSATEGGLFGWVGFDGHFVFGVYPHVLRFDHDTRRWSEFGGLSQLRQPVVATSPPTLVFEPLVARQAFVQAVHRAQDYIAAGDIYQVNLAHPWIAPWPETASSLAFYRQLRHVSPAPYAAFLDLDGKRIFSSSPECFLHLRGSEIITRPIKGTRPRFTEPEHDQASAHALASSIKENAELLMITDLERNDLGQVCEFGSVTVPELASVERFAQVFHLVSTVQGRLRPDIDHATAFKACFPGGSISGAPKKRALEIIAELEPHPRGLYTGAIGYFGFNGESQFNIVIRTAIQQGDRISFHVGAGIVADSVPEFEYEETLHKAAGLLRAANA